MNIVFSQDQAYSMIELPIFPLNTVLFPGMPINLHIFEERYKLMINACIEKRQPFGVVLIANHKSDTNPGAKPHRVGCTAQITQVQPLGDGQMRITAVGQERFEIISISQQQPYLVSMAEYFPLLESDPAILRQKASRLRHHVVQYLEQLRKLGQIHFSGVQLPESPMALSYLSAVILQTPLDQKQDLLTIGHAEAFIDSLYTTYRREAVLLRALATTPDGIDYDDTYSLS